MDTLPAYRLHSAYQHVPYVNSRSRQTEQPSLPPYWSRIPYRFECKIFPGAIFLFPLPTHQEIPPLPDSVTQRLHFCAIRAILQVNIPAEQNDNRPIRRDLYNRGSYVGTVVIDGKWFPEKSLEKLQKVIALFPVRRR